MASKTLYVGNLPYTATNEELKEFFGKVGTVVSASVIMDRYSGRSKGFGFVDMETEEAAAAAVEQLNGASLGGRDIKVSEARPKEKK